MNYLWKLRDDERGQDLIEYALMAGFVAVMVAAIMPTVPASITRIYTRLSNELTRAGG